eukprot:16433913-Heterocapsa_arctica.AAC.1
MIYRFKFHRPESNDVTERFFGVVAGETEVLRRQWLHTSARRRAPLGLRVQYGAKHFSVWAKT